jgi:hypothetical protein
LILSPEKIIAHNEYACIHRSQHFMHSIPYKQRVSEANKFRKQHKIL